MKKCAPSQSSDGAQHLRRPNAVGRRNLVASEDAGVLRVVTLGKEILVSR